MESKFLNEISTEIVFQHMKLYFKQNLLNNTKPIKIENGNTHVPDTIGKIPSQQNI